MIYTGCSKSPFPYVRLNSSGCGCPIDKIFAGIAWYFRSFEEYVKIKSIGVHFFEWTFIFCVFRPFSMLGSRALLVYRVWPIKIRYPFKNQNSIVSGNRDKMTFLFRNELIGLPNQSRHLIYNYTMGAWDQLIGCRCHITSQSISMTRNRKCLITSVFLLQFD